MLIVISEFVLLMRCSSHFRDLYSILYCCCWSMSESNVWPALCLARCRRGWGVNYTARSDKRLRPDLCGVTSCQGASWRLCGTEGICRQRTRDGGAGRPAEPALRNQPFMSRRLALSFRGSRLFATEAARQILAVLLHLLLLCDSRPPHLFPTPYSYTLHLSNAQKRTGAQWRDILASPRPCTGVLTQGEQR